MNAWAIVKKQAATSVKLLGMKIKSLMKCDEANMYSFKTHYAPDGYLMAID